MKNPLSAKDIAIIGYAETRIVRRSNRSTYDLAAEATSKALEHAGVRIDEIDGLATLIPDSEAGNNFWSNYLGDHLGLTTRWTQSSDLGGASSIANVARAAAALQSGQCEMVLSVAASAPSTSRSCGR